MKCLCGYEFNSDKPKNYDNKPFFKIEVSLNIPGGSGEFSSWGWLRPVLYACPKCHTIRLGEQ